MPREMSLGGSTPAGPAPVNRESLLFAAHALAILKVHESSEAQAKGLTLRTIGQADSYMHERVDELTYSLFRTFGKQCVPVLTGFIAEDSEFQDGAKIESFAQEICRKLNL